MNAGAVEKILSLALGKMWKVWDPIVVVSVLVAIAPVMLAMWIGILGIGVEANKEGNDNGVDRRFASEAQSTIAVLILRVSRLPIPQLRLPLFVSFAAWLNTF